MERQCQRNIFEKEDKALENENKLKQEEQAILKMEKELREMEAKLKEKKQENNLLDFKLRDMARVNDSEVKFIRPHAGVHKGLLNNNLNLPLASTLFI